MEQLRTSVVGPLPLSVLLLLSLTSLALSPPGFASQGRETQTERTKKEGRKTWKGADDE